MTRQGPNATAEYLATMCNQLTEIAERDGLEVGAYLLRMARLEFAERTETQTPPANQANR